MIFECTIEALMNGDNDPHYDVQLISLLHQIANTLNHCNYPEWKQTLQDKGITDALRDFASRYKQSNDYAYTKLRMLLRSLEVEMIFVVSSKTTSYFFHFCGRKKQPLFGMALLDPLQGRFNEGREKNPDENDRFALAPVSGMSEYSHLY